MQEAIQGEPLVSAELIMDQAIIGEYMPGLLVEEVIRLLNIKTRPGDRPAYR